MGLQCSLQHVSSCFEERWCFFSPDWQTTSPSSSSSGAGNQHAGLSWAPPWLCHGIPGCCGIPQGRVPGSVQWDWGRAHHRRALGRGHSRSKALGPVGPSTQYGEFKQRWFGAPWGSIDPPLPSRLCTVPCYGLGTGLWAKAGGAGRKGHIRTAPRPPATSAPPQSPSSPAPPPWQGLPHCCPPVMAQALPPAHNSSPCVPASCCRSPSWSWHGF